MPPSGERSTFAAVTRTVLAVVAGAAAAVLAAVTVGEYALSAADVWLEALIVPAIIGTIMSSIGRQHRRLWVATGLIAGGAVGWGIGISTSWGIEPVPGDAWFALAAATVWPIVWGVVVPDRSPGARGSASQGSVTQRSVTQGSVNDQLSDSGLVRGPKVGDP